MTRKVYSGFLDPLQDLSFPVGHDKEGLFWLSRSVTGFVIPCRTLSERDNADHDETWLTVCLESTLALPELCL